MRVLILFCLVFLVSCSRSPVFDVQAVKPNIVLIVADDMRADDLQYMPLTRSWLTNHGTRFTRAFVPHPSCCPARVSILRGQYTHNHHVWTNALPYAYQTFYEQGLESSTLATWLKSVGYKTALIGKYLNEYPGTTVPSTHVPLGWDYWTAFSGEQAYYNYTLNENGSLISYGSLPEHYSTDVFKTKALSYLTTVRDPFFLYLTPTAPHGPYQIPQRHQSLFTNYQAPRSVNFNEADVTDKPYFISRLPLLTETQIIQIDARFRNRLRLLQSLDELVAAVIQKLSQQGKLANTYIVFTSDNGYKLGNHRAAAKNTSYEEDIKVPLVIRGPNIPVSVRTEMVLNIDLAPTIATWAGATYPTFVDGKPMQGLWSGLAWRKVIGLESYDQVGVQRYSGVRTLSWKYVEWYSTLRPTEYEIYNLVSDPYEEKNIYATADPTLVSNLRALLLRQKACQSVGCP